jgi:hypothetical protein
MSIDGHINVQGCRRTLPRGTTQYEPSTQEAPGTVGTVPGGLRPSGLAEFAGRRRVLAHRRHRGHHAIAGCGDGLQLRSCTGFVGEALIRPRARRLRHLHAGMRIGWRGRSRRRSHGVRHRTSTRAAAGLRVARTSQSDARRQQSRREEVQHDSSIFLKETVAQAPQSLIGQSVSQHRMSTTSRCTRSEKRRGD